MATRKSMWVLFGILMISAWVLLWPTPIQAGAETMNFKFFSHVERLEAFPVGDIEGHIVAIEVREGAVIFANGELAWMKAINSVDRDQGATAFDQYSTVSFQDGSKITCHNKGGRKGEKRTAAAGTGKWAGEIINGTGRFQGIKGTAAAQIKILFLLTRMKQREDGEERPLADGTFEYTLPSK